MIVCNLILQGNLKTDIFETNVAGMFATEKAREGIAENSGVGIG